MQPLYWQNVVVASKSGPVDTGPTVLVATALTRRVTTIPWACVVEKQRRQLPQLSGSEVEPLARQTWPS